MEASEVSKYENKSRIFYAFKNIREFKGWNISNSWNI